MTRNSQFEMLVGMDGTESQEIFAKLMLKRFNPVLSGEIEVLDSSGNQWVSLKNLYQSNELKDRFQLRRLNTGEIIDVLLMADKVQNAVRVSFVPYFRPDMLQVMPKKRSLLVRAESLWMKNYKKTERSDEK